MIIATVDVDDKDRCLDLPQPHFMNVVIDAVERFHMQLHMILNHTHTAIMTSVAIDMLIGTW